MRSFAKYRNKIAQFHSHSSSFKIKIQLNYYNINKQFVDLGVKHKFKDDGLIIPMVYSNRIFFKLDYFQLELLNQFKDINQAFKEKHNELKVKNLGRLLEINQLIPDDFYHINFEYFDDLLKDKKENSVSEIINNLD